MTKNTIYCLIANDYLMYDQRFSFQSLKTDQ